MTQELKPCPFCGEMPTLYGAQVMINDDCPESIDCDNELCSMSVTTGYRLFDESVDAWNRRADLPPTLAQALALPEIAALVAAAREVHRSFWYDSDGVIRGIYDLESSLAKMTP